MFTSCLQSRLQGNPLEHCILNLCKRVNKYLKRKRINKKEQNKEFSERINSFFTLFTALVYRLRLRLSTISGNENETTNVTLGLPGFFILPVRGSNRPSVGLFYMKKTEYMKYNGNYEINIKPDESVYADTLNPPRQVINLKNDNLNALLNTLYVLSQSANMVTDNAPIIELIKLKIKEVIKLINNERSTEKRALPISEESTRRYYKNGHTYYKVCARGQQVKRSDFIDFLTELCKIYFPLEEICIETGKKQIAPTVLSVGKKYIEYVEFLASNEEISWGTYSHKLSKWNKYIKDSDFSKIPIEKVTYPDIKNYYRSVTSGRAIARENLRGIKTVINGIFNYALNDLGFNVVDPTRVDTNDLKCKVSKRQSVYLPDERDLIINECLKGTDIYSKLFILMFCMPVRIGEMMGLMWDCVDLDSNRITIKREIVRTRKNNKECYELVEHTKCRTEETQDEERCIPVHASITEMLRQVKQVFPSETYVFVSSVGNHLYSSHIYDHLRDICHSVGVDYKATHKMRFWAVSTMYEGNIPENVIMKYAGHKDVNTTRHYNRSRFFSSDSDDEVRNLMKI